ncbi:MAG TPA: hypothetical protein VFK10_10610 [Burkholderiaceae bacterium]|nr:hypothetical protein [Burkholderiaceae bacterium]
MRRWVVSALAAACGTSWAVDLYTCEDDKGVRITRDRYIAECSHKEQRILNPDGSLRKVVPPTLTPDEQARRDEEARRKRDEEQKRAEAIKYDRLLLTRYPDKASHDRARETALSDSRFAIESAKARLRELDTERKRLLSEAEFYRGRAMPPTLKQQLDANDAAAAAQRLAIENARAEQARIHAKFDAELERLRKLWGGAMPGTLGPPPVP